MACDAVDVSPENGVVLKGIIDHLTLDHEGSFALLWRAWDLNEPFTISFGVRYPDRTKHQSEPVEVELDRDNPVQSGGTDVTLEMLRITEPGMHRIHLLIDGHGVASTPLYIRPPRRLH